METKEKVATIPCTQEIKQKLIEDLIDQPFEFTDEEFSQLVDECALTQNELKHITKRLFDINDGSILNRSEASHAFMGRLNKKSQKRRNRRYFAKIRKGFRSNPDHKLILAEGDSWFEYPLLICEIVDWLGKRSDYATFSLAYGADWLSNILYEGKYVEELSVHCPDVFLVSGGGNDLVGGNRLATMVYIPDKDEVQDRNSIQEAEKEVRKYFTDDNINEALRKQILSGCKYLTKEFFSFIKVLKLQYRLLFENLKMKAEKFEKMKIITVGYDYAIPSFNLGFGWKIHKWHKPVSNILLTKNGRWLKQPLMLRGITDQQVQEAIIAAMIFLFNEMLIEVGKGYPNVYHIDCRGAVPRNGWYNELHPESHIFEKIARTFALCIDDPPHEKRVYRVKDIPDKA